jgi:geranylgeranyl diphosphate synthase type I
MTLRIGWMHSVVERDDIEAALASAIHRFDGASPVTEQLHHHFGYLDRGGAPCPRVRMQLVLEVAAAEGTSPDDALDLGAAVEILHNYSLVHLDIEDGGDARGGREAVWQRYGIAHGINAGDALCALAYLEVLTGCDHRTPERTLLMTHVLQDANYAMCAGQAADIAFDRAEHVAPDAYLTMIENKTGALFGAACQLGALHAGADEQRARAYARLGRTYGIAVQIADDCMGTSSRRWTYPSVAAASPGAAEPRDAARAYVAEADSVAAAAGIDADGRVRAFFARAIFPTV